MAARPATAAQKAQRELEDLQLVMRARNGDSGALDVLIRRYTGFVRLKASSYFLAGGDSEDLVQEGLIGLYKAVRDATGRKVGKIRKLGELNWRPYEQVMRSIENGGLPLEREMITPRDFVEAPELREVFRSQM